MTHPYDVYLRGRLVDTVFHTHPEGFKTREEREEDVRRGLVNHDGYDAGIEVRERKEIKRR